MYKSNSQLQPNLRPKVSVCMATYNGERFIASQLQTILKQLLPNDEVIISDDSSTDSTLDIIQQFNDERIQLFSGQTFHSPIYNFEHALKQATGDIIFLSDQDDEWVDGWVDLALSELCSVSLVVCDADVIDSNGRIRSPSEAVIYRGGKRGSGLIKNIYRNGYIGCCCAFRKEVLGVALPFPRNLPWHDWWIGLVAELFFSTRFVEDRKIHYRRHGGNASPTGEISTAPLKEKLLMRWNLCLPILKRWLAVKLPVN